MYNDVTKPLENWLDLQRVRLNSVPILNSTSEFASVQSDSEVIAPVLGIITTVYSHDMGLQ